MAWKKGGGDVQVFIVFRKNSRNLKKSDPREKEGSYNETAKKGGHKKKTRRTVQSEEGFGPVLIKWITFPQSGGK